MPLPLLNAPPFPVLPVALAGAQAGDFEQGMGEQGQGRAKVM